MQINMVNKGRNIMSSKYDAKWTGYGHVVTFKSTDNKATGRGSWFSVYVDGVHKAGMRDYNHAKALFTGIINQVRDEQIS